MAERGRDVGIADPVVGDHVGRRVDCRQQRDGEQQLLRASWFSAHANERHAHRAAGRLGGEGRSSLVIIVRQRASCVVRRAWARKLLFEEEGVFRSGPKLALLIATIFELRGGQIDRGVSPADELLPRRVCRG